MSALSILAAVLALATVSTTGAILSTTSNVLAAGPLTATTAPTWSGEARS